MEYFCIIAWIVKAVWTFVRFSFYLCKHVFLKLCISFKSMHKKWQAEEYFLCQKNKKETTVLKDILSASIKSASQLDISGFPKNILKTGQNSSEFSDKKKIIFFFNGFHWNLNMLTAKKEALNMLVNNAMFIILLWKECWIYIFSVCFLAFF